MRRKSQRSLYAELPKVGDRVTAGEPMGTVESVKAISEIFSRSRER